MVLLGWLRLLQSYGAAPTELRATGQCIIELLPHFSLAYHSSQSLYQRLYQWISFFHLLPPFNNGKTVFVSRFNSTTPLRHQFRPRTE